MLQGKDWYGTFKQRLLTKELLQPWTVKTYKYMTSISKNVYINTLADMVYKCNNTYHITIKMKPVDIKPNTYLDFNVENNDKKVVNGKEIVRKFYEKELQKGNSSDIVHDRQGSKERRQ